MASERGALLGGARVKQENEQIFETPPSLRDLRHLLHATYRELTRYKLWKARLHSSYVLFRPMSNILNRRIVGCLWHLFKNTLHKTENA